MSAYNNPKWKRIACEACTKEFHVKGASARGRKYCNDCREIKEQHGISIKMMAIRKEEIPKLAHALVDNPRISFIELSALTGIPQRRIKTHFFSNELLQNMRMAGSRKVTMMIPKAIQAVDDILSQTDNQDVRLKAAVKVLDKEKILGNETVDINVNIRNKTTEELIQVINEAKQIPAPTILEANLVTD